MLSDANAPSADDLQKDASNDALPEPGLDIALSEPLESALKALHTRDGTGSSCRVRPRDIESPSTPRSPSNRSSRPTRA